MTTDIARRTAGWLARATGRLGCLLALLGLVAGIPAGLVHVVGWPLPRSIPANWTAWQQILTSAFPDTAVINLLAIALWIAWAAFVYSILLELRAARHGDLARRRRPISPMQAIAAFLIAGMSTGPAAVVSAIPPPPPAAVQPASAVPALAVGHPEPPSHVRTTHTMSVHASTGHTGHTATPVPAAEATRETPRFAVAAIDGTVTVATGHHQYTVTVHRGDTLWDLADAWLGDPRRWPEIYQLNRHRYDHHGYMQHGDHIEPGWVLTLPVDARPPAGAAPIPAPPPAAPDIAPSDPAPAAPNPPAASSAPSPGVDDGVIEPPPAALGTAVPVPEPSTSTTSPSPAAAPTATNERRTGQPGVDIPGRGWVTVPVATAVAAAVALMWIHRRRRYRLGNLMPSRSTDPDLRPSPPTIAVLHRSRPEPTRENDREDPMELPAPEIADATTVIPVTLGVQSDRSLRLPDVPALGVGLAGPGAHDAARGVLAAVLSAGGPWAAGDEATITTTDADLTALLGRDCAPYQLDRLKIAASLDDALADLERHLLRRARQAADSSDLTTIAGADPDRPMPPIVLLTAAPGGAAATRLAAILAVGSRLAITGVLVGAWDVGATWHVNSDGTIQPQSGSDTTTARLNVLDAAAVTAILDTLREAHPTTTDLPPPPTKRLNRPANQPTVVTTEPPPHPTGDAPTPAPHRRHLRLSVLGRPSIGLIDADATSDIRIRRSDGLQILIHLAAEPDGATSDQLIGVLWPEVHRHSARGRFHTTMSELRQTLAEALGHDAIIRPGERYRINPDHVQVDLWQLRRAVDHAATTVHPDEHAAALRRVVNLYTGPIADGYSWLWLAPYQEATRRHVLDAYARLADIEPDSRNALALIQNAIRLDPYNEDIYQRAMRLHTALGNTDGIRRTLRALTERLTELEVSVSPQTERLASELLTKLDARVRKRGTAA